MTTTTHAEQVAATLTRYREELERGTTFHYAAQSHGSRRGYEPPCTRRGWSHAIVTLGRMAAVSDPLAQLARAAIHGLNLYGTDSQACSKIYQQAATAVAAGYDDVIRRASPEPGRPSTWVRPYTLRELVIAVHWLEYATRQMNTGSANGVGWAARAVAAELNVYPHELPEQEVH